MLISDRLHITFIDKEGDEHTFEVAEGDNLLDIALENDIEMEGNCSGALNVESRPLITYNRRLRRVMRMFDMSRYCGE